MRGRLVRRNARVLLVLVFSLWMPLTLAAQPGDGDSGSRRKSGTYLKGGLAHWQGDIFSRGSLTNWNVDLFGTDYNLTSVSVAIERYFGGTAGFAGFSIAYRKDAIQHANTGHMFSAGLFGDADVKVAALKMGGGIEWGMPSLNFDLTEFSPTADGTVQYRHTYPLRNADVPFVGTTTDGAVYPFVEVSAVQRPSVFLFEIGMRINLIGFHFDDYEVGQNDRVRHAFERKRMVLPYLFVNAGIRMG
jgi:hypothetical protein